MVHVNKKYLDKALRTKAWGRLLKVVKKSNFPDTLALNLGKFLTPSEIIMLEKRLSIPVLVERGLSYRDIGAILDVSSVTISFVKHNLTKRSVVHKKYTINEKPRERKYRRPRYKEFSPLF